MFGQFKLRTRMLLGYVTPTAIYVTMFGIMSYLITEQVFNTFKEVRRVQEIIITTNNVTLSAIQMVRSARGYMVDKDQSFLKEYEEGYRLAVSASEVLSKQIISEEQRKRLEKINQLIEEYYKDTNVFIDLFKNGKRNEALNLFRQGKTTNFVREFDVVTQEFSAAEQKKLEAETKAAEAALENLRLGLVISSVLLLILAVAIAWWISGGVAKTINQAVGSIATSSTQIAATVEEQERMASQQAASVHETTTTMDELGSSSKVTAEQIEAAVTQAKQALSLAHNGTKAVGLSLEAMSNLKTKVERMQEQIVHLSEQTGQIGNISTVVSDLANQTNMLALNAAVEAVRAGEHGKGFAVVATEIRKLADQSKKSATQINALVFDIQEAINSTVMVTDEGTKTVDEGASIAQETAQVFAGVSDAINNIVVSSQQILLNAKQQAIAIQQVVDAMNSLNQAAIQAANGVSQTRIGTQKLNETALELKGII